MMYSEAQNESPADAALSRCIDELKRDLLVSDRHLTSDRAHRIARRLCFAGWHAPGRDAFHPVGSSAADITLDTRFLLGNPLLERTGIRGREEKLELAFRFSSEGAVILDLRVGEDDVSMEFLLTVEQAMFALAPMRAPLASLVSWLRGAGYRGDIEGRVRELAIRLEQIHSEPLGAGKACLLLPIAQASAASQN